MQGKVLLTERLVVLLRERLHVHLLHAPYHAFTASVLALTTLVDLDDTGIHLRVFNVVVLFECLVLPLHVPIALLFFPCVLHLAFQAGSCHFHLVVLQEVSVSSLVLHSSSSSRLQPT